MTFGSITVKAVVVVVTILCGVGAWFNADLYQRDGNIWNLLLFVVMIVCLVVNGMTLERLRK